MCNAQTCIQVGSLSRASALCHMSKCSVIKLGEGFFVRIFGGVGIIWDLTKTIGFVLLPPSAFFHAEIVATLTVDWEESIEKYGKGGAEEKRESGRCVTDGELAQGGVRVDAPLNVCCTLLFITRAKLNRYDYFADSRRWVGDGRSSVISFIFGANKTVWTFCRSACDDSGLFRVWHPVSICTLHRLVCRRNA